VIGYVLRRLGIAIVLIWIVSVVTFALYVTVPEEPAGFLVDLQHATPAQIADARHALGVDKPILTRYGDYVWRALHGDLGISWQGAGPFGNEIQGIPVGPMLWDALRVTGSLVLGGLALMLVIAVPLGILAASRPRSWVDRLSVALGLAAISTHPLVVGLLLQLFAGTRWGTVPASGYCPLIGTGPKPPPLGIALPPPGECGGVADWASHLLLPWLTFALFFVALYMRVVRARMIEVLDEPYIQTARAKGASETQVIRGHALRNAAPPLVTMLGMDAGMAIGIAMYVESVYRLPGLGRTAVLALGGPAGIDLPVVLGVTLVAAAVVILLNLAVDLIVLVVDPRISRTGVRGAVRPDTAPAA
jgi:peptide/nickel transport system permease protein